MFFIIESKNSRLSSKVANNFSEDIKSGEIYAALLEQLFNSFYYFIVFFFNIFGYIFFFK
jgi:hypothetical protein